MKKVILFLMSISLLFSLVACSSKVTVTFNPDNGEPTQSIEIIVGSTVNFPKTPTKEGYEFKGWFFEDLEFTASSTFKQNVTLVAKWEKVLKEFTISYDAGEGANMSADVPTKFKEGDGAKVKLPKPTKSGYLFLGWFDENDNKVEVLENKDYQLFAKWEVAETFEIIFKTGDKVYATVAALEGSTIDVEDLPVDPTKEDYRFEGWYLGDVKYDFNTVVTGDLELVAKWKQVKKVFVISVSTPDSIVKYNHNKGDQKVDGDSYNDQNVFKVQNLIYVVGDDNSWFFKPQVNYLKFALDENGNRDDSSFEEVIPTSWDFEIKIYKFNQSTQAYDILVDNNDSTVIDNIDYQNCKIDFATSAVGGNYQVKVYPQGLTQNQTNNIEKYTISLNIDVVDGYNVYTAKELAYANNRNDVFKEAWDDFKTANGLQLNYVPTRLILQNDVKITTDAFPSQFLYSAEEAAKYGDAANREYILGENKITVKLEGSLKDNEFIYYRDLQNTESFTISGNYFKIDASAIPLVINEWEVGSELTALGKVISHSALFKMKGEDQQSKFVIENTAFVGNANRTESAIKGGGIILAKAECTAAEFNNNVSSCFFITYHLEKSIKEILIDNCKAYDGFNSFVYNWGANNVQLKNSEMIGCGGPVVIQDHVYPEDEANSFIGQITITDCNLQAYVTGAEGWFVLVGADGLVPTIKMLDNLFNPLGRSFLKTQSELKFMNVICVNKSGNAQSITAEKIKGSTTIVNTETEFNYSFNFGKENPYLAGMLDNTFGQTATFESSAGGFGYATADGVLDITNTLIADPKNAMYQGDYLTIYYNGMAIILEYFQAGLTLN